MPDKIFTPTNLQSCIPSATAGMIEICGRLARLEKEWTALFNGENRALGDATAPGGCSFEENSMILTVNVRDASKLAGIRFKEKFFRETVSRFLGVKIKKVEFVSGRVERVSSAKAASRAYERYVPQLVTDEQVETEKETLRNLGAGEEITNTLARIKAIAAKRAGALKKR